MLPPPPNATAPLRLRLDVLAGPAAGKSATTKAGASELTLGRNLACGLALPDDGEVSGTHAIARWDASERAWALVDVGSLNGTRVNGREVGGGRRRRGRAVRLAPDDILTLGGATVVRMAYLPGDVVVEPSSAGAQRASIDGSAAAAANAAAAASAAAATTAATPAACAAFGTTPPLRLPFLSPPHPSSSTASSSAPLVVGGLRPLATVDAETWTKSSEVAAAAALLLSGDDDDDASGGGLGGGAREAARRRASLEFRGGSTAAEAQLLSASGSPMPLRRSDGRCESLGVSAAGVTFLGVEHARRGMRCEDVVLCLPPPLDGISSSTAPSVAALMVFDGHGGAGAAGDAAEALPAALAEKLLVASSSLPEEGDEGDEGEQGQKCPLSAPDAAAWKEAFESADAASPADGGSTATVVLVWRSKGGGDLLIRAANVGDSSALLIESDDVDRDGGESEEEGEEQAPPSSTSAVPPKTPEQRPQQLRSSGNPSSSSRGTASAPLVQEGDDDDSSAAATPDATAAADAAAAAAAAGTETAAPASEPEPKLRITRLSADHRVSAAPERARLAAAGVPLPPSAGARLYGLNLSRCLGDRAIKESGLGLSGGPHVSPVLRMKKGKSKASPSSFSCPALVLLASDGLWDVASPSRAAAVARAAATASLRDGESDAEAADAAARAVAALARRRHSRDDITAAVALLRP